MSVEMQTIEINGINQKVWRAQLIKLEPPFRKLVFQLDGTAPLSVRGLNLLPKGLEGKCALMLRLATHSGTFKILTSHSSLTFIVKPACAYNAIESIDTKNKRIHFVSGPPIWTEISSARLTPVEEILVQLATQSENSKNFNQRFAELNSLVDAVAKGDYERQRIIEQLRESQGNEVSAFLEDAKKVNVEDLLYFQAIIQCGSRSKAAVDLKMPKSTLYDKVRKWPSRGAEYKRMHDFIESARNKGKRRKVRLPSSFAYSDTSIPEDPEIARELMNLDDSLDSDKGT